MRAYTLALLCATAGAGLVGCSSNEEATTAKPTVLAANAARTNYPTDVQPQDGMKVSALVDKLSGDLTIRNFAPDPIRNANLWVNHAYLVHIQSVDPNAALVIHRNQLFNSNGNSLGDSKATIDVVQLQVNGALYSVLGPQMM